MAEYISRRNFVSSTAAGALFAGEPPMVIADDRNHDSDSSLLQGDTHFDCIEQDDQKWMWEHFPKDIRKVEYYCRHTTEDSA